MNNARIADVFDEIADLLEFQAANPFRVRAYRNGARAIRACVGADRGALGDLTQACAGHLEKADFKRGAVAVLRRPHVRM